ncbi:ABC transporter ATP-binding protein [Gluconobacter wancherniae]|uniref:ABC transporter ATP-binding protein n=1 Tax=Gluconobacter wancherniae TaxID=1307955 RepID=UPI001B8BD09C|nr:ABC transporter ATP-binding protein [Gluconobacter wancherniae]MBS1062417.1 ABC transporter ATP-binding protein [Gluconobacter wancherniae]
MPSVVVEKLQVSFPLYHGQSRSLKRHLGRALSGINGNSPTAHLAQDARERVVVEVLRGIDFTLRPGDRLGLIGGNGAGKTTLLRALAGIYEPVGGRVRIEGTLGTLLDSSLGMNPELSGQENIRLRGLYSGLSRAQTAAVERDVEEFAELGSYMKMPIKAYSSGMSVRLAFGLATAIAPQVLLMDEWFMAGDGAFRNKARKRLEDIVGKAEIMVLSSHMPEVMREWCTRVLWLENGLVKMDGKPDDVLSAYLAPKPAL